MDSEDEYEDGNALLKDLRRQLKEVSAKNKQLEDELAEVHSATRSKTVSAKLQAAGFPEALARFVPPDLGIDDLDSWLEEHGTLFRRSDDAAPAAGSDAPPPEVVSEQRRASALQEGSIPAQKLEEIKSQIANAETEEEVNRLMREAKQFIL